MAFPFKLSQAVGRCISPIRTGSPTRTVSPIRPGASSSSSPLCQHVMSRSPSASGRSILSRFLSPTRATSPQRMYTMLHNGSPSRMLSPDRAGPPIRSASGCGKPPDSKCETTKKICPQSACNTLKPKKVVKTARPKRCRPYPVPPCMPASSRFGETDIKCSTNPCLAENKAKKETFKSMWKVPKECCISECPDVLPRFDEMYYRPSDKNRCYTPTWVECPPFLIRPKKVCEYDKLECCEKPCERRPKCDRPKTARKTCPPPGLDLMQCKKLEKSSICKKIRLPRCGGARPNPSCKIEVRPSDCVKICAPYPSFSECKRNRPHPLRKKECFCHVRPTMCEVYAWKRRMERSLAC